jgi:hypothetical protein
LLISVDNFVSKINYFSDVRVAAEEHFARLVELLHGKVSKGGLLLDSLADFLKLLLGAARVGGVLRQLQRLVHPFVSQKGL